ncbi:MAG TPA: hypothetical protein VGC79_28945 [Polyangiaceae bacterium]
MGRFRVGRVARHVEHASGELGGPRDLVLPSGKNFDRKPDTRSVDYGISQRAG